MKFVFLSDTHGKHDQVPVPEGDCLVYCGDISSVGELHEIESFSLFLKKLTHKHKVVIAGNHDFSFEDERKQKAEELIRSAGAAYLNDSGLRIEGLNFWGSPIQPWFHDWAFNRRRGPDIKKHWDLIPENTDVLITHGPPYGILDKTVSDKSAGCEELLKKIKEIKPKIHAFGHIHESAGLLEKDGIIFINACNLNREYQYQNPPIELNFVLNK